MRPENVSFRYCPVLGPPARHSGRMASEEEQERVSGEEREEVGTGTLCRVDNTIT